MPKGWHIVFTENDRVRVFDVGIADRNDAVRAVTEDRDKIYGIIATPLTPDEIEQLRLGEGDIINSR